MHIGESAFRRTMRPDEWTFVLALPVTERSFLYALAVGEYCHNYSSWDDYSKRFLSLFREYIEPLEKAAGLRVLRGATLKRYANSLRGNRGVVLFTHCNVRKSLVEFADGMHSYEEIANRISSNYTGIADVSVCNPAGFEEALKLRAPCCVVKVTASKLNPTFWFPFYAQLLSEFAVADSCYAEAILRTTDLFGAEAQIDILTP